MSISILKLHSISREEGFLADNVRILAPQANVLASPIITHSQIFLLEPLHEDKIQIHSLVASDVHLLETLINQRLALSNMISFGGEDGFTSNMG